jgi:hypothetical protein
MITLFKNEFCEIKRTINNKLLRVDLILGTEMYIPHYISKNGKLIK